ncbi:RTA1 like protein-domain-containing protein [Echria macrotheca]|uniref:RTA1 like protein-domain-containing protein n=1 Tax=Echria macrotheca TaxID=438768 RepID=A0AAJ0F636_9PEZI|nr:RTA1 like protein-domain-containing protein [Echria macrotheca]
MDLPLIMATRTILRRDDYDDEPTDCVTATPGPNGHVPLDACNSYYNYDPQFAPAVAVAVIFGILLGIHFFEATVFKKKYAWVVIMGALWETAAFAIHAVGTRDQQQIGLATAWSILFLLAPLWINAFVYMTFARMVNFWSRDAKVAGISARRISLFFVLADVLSFIVQAAGGIMASPGAAPETVKTGLNIYTGGTALQQLFIFIFLGLMIMFHRACSPLRNGVSVHGGGRDWKPLLLALYGVLVCITIRIIFRIIEFSRGFTPDNPVPFHEEYIYALDCFPMMVALLVLAIWHPGRFLSGSDGEFPKRTRAQKRAEKLEMETKMKLLRGTESPGEYV